MGRGLSTSSALAEFVAAPRGAIGRSCRAGNRQRPGGRASRPGRHRRRRPPPEPGETSHATARDAVPGAWRLNRASVSGVPWLSRHRATHGRAARAELGQEAVGVLELLPQLGEHQLPLQRPISSSGSCGKRNAATMSLKASTKL